MAAPVLQSVQYTTLTSGGSKVVTKPVDLAVGDLMIAQYYVNLGDISSVPSGFTFIDSIAGPVVDSGQMVSALYYKIADSGDVAASNFTFTSGTTRMQSASIARITGASTIPSSYVYGEGTVSNSGTPSIGAGVTPKDYGAGTVLIQYWGQRTNTSATGGYAVATSDPGGWVEGYDELDGTNYGVSMAYATRTPVTATGNISCSGGGGTTDWSGQLISIPQPNVFSVSETITLTEGISKVVNKTISDTISLIETFLNIFNRFTNQSKNSSSYTNQAKNSTTFTNQNKNSSTWANEDKK